MNPQQLIERVQQLEQALSQLQTKMVSQSDILNGSVKQRHVGEGVKYIQSGLDAALPKTGDTPQLGTTIYFATDTNKLYVWNGTAWKSTTLT